MAELYKQLYQELKNAIMNDTYPAGSFLPSESTLTTEHHCSRDTVRKALRQLEIEGFIQKQRGRGSQVLQHKLWTFPLSGLTSYKEIENFQSLQSSTKVILFEIVSVNEELAHITGFVIGTSVYHIIRVRIINAITSIIDEDYLDTLIIPGLTLADAKNSLYQYIEGTLGLQIGYSEKQITCPVISPSDRALMPELPSEEHRLIQVESRSYLADTTLFQHTFSKHRPDQFKFDEFARRQSY